MPEPRAQVGRLGSVVDRGAATFDIDEADPATLFPRRRRSAETVGRPSAADQDEQQRNREDQDERK